MTTSVINLSRLLGLPVEDEAGRSMGRVYDVRVRQTQTGSPTRPPTYEIEGLIVGERGMRVRLGWRRARGPGQEGGHDLLRWDDVLAVESERLLVRRR